MTCARVPDDAASAEVSAAGSDFMVSMSLLDAHGEDLLCMARLITNSVETARTVVSQVLGSGADGVDLTGRDNVCVRTALATRVYRECRTAGVHNGDGPESINDSIAWLARRCAQQRSALALYLYGELRPYQVGTLLGLPTRVVRLLLVSALSDLAETHLADRDLWPEAEVARRPSGQVGATAHHAIRCRGWLAREHATGHQPRSSRPCLYTAVGHL